MLGIALVAYFVVFGVFSTDVTVFGLDVSILRIDVAAWISHLGHCCEYLFLHECTCVSSRFASRRPSGLRLARLLVGDDHADELGVVAHGVAVHDDSFLLLLQRGWSLTAFTPSGAS